MFEKPILIYSEYCQYSDNFLKILIKHQQIFDSFIRICIDTNPQTKKRPDSFYQIQSTLGIKLTKVPTIILPKSSDYLSDKEAFKWLEYQIQSLLKNTPTECIGFNSNEMTSLSDSYANFGSTDLNDATSQSYRFFVNKELTDDNYLNTDKSWTNSEKTNGFLNDQESSNKIDYASKQNERQHFDESRQQNNNNSNSNFNIPVNTNNITQNDVNTFTQQRQTNQTQQGNKSQQNIDFTNPNFGLSGKLGNTNTIKGKDLDDKLNRLLQDREQIDASLQQKRQF
jgi:hypothetical protein